jgi:hypothetical protein
VTRSGQAVRDRGAQGDDTAVIPNGRREPAPNRSERNLTWLLDQCIADIVVDMAKRGDDISSAFMVEVHVG